MKAKQLKIWIYFGYIFVASLFVGCSKDETSVANEANTISVGEKINFMFSMQRYGEDNEVTRTAQLYAKSEILDLGDGLMAEITVERDTADVTISTRATKEYPTDGYYSIYAVDASNNRVGNVLKGTLRSRAKLVLNPANPYGGEYVYETTFTRDANSVLELPPGTYTFVCYNDAVTDDGTNLSIKSGTKMPLIGRTTATITSLIGTQNVEFEMKHPTARVQINLLSLIGSGGDDGAAFVSVKQALTPTTVKGLQYVTDASSATLIAGSGEVIEDELQRRAQSDPVTGISRSTVLSNYHYLLPCNGSDVKLEFVSGACYRKSFANKSTTLAVLGALAANGAYKLNIRVLPVFEYLFNDGTTGYLKNKGGRTPIGIVVRKREGTTPGLAAALDVVNTTYYAAVRNSTYGNKQIYQSHSEALKDMNGYANTWDGNTSTDNAVKATSANYPAFQVAGSYSPSVPTSGIGRWFLPSLGQIELMMYNIGFSRKNTRDYLVNYACLAFFYPFFEAGGGNNLRSYYGLLPGINRFLSSTSVLTNGDSYFYEYWANYHNGFYNNYGHTSMVLPFVEF